MSRSHQSCAIVFLWRLFEQSHAGCTFHRLMMWFFFIFYRWRLGCPTGYYLNSFNFKTTGQCCRPLHHPQSYGPCYDEDGMLNTGRRGCQLAGYYITGLIQHCRVFFICIEKVRCCKMIKTGNSILPDSHIDQESIAK